MVKESLFFFAFAVVLLFRVQAVQAQEVNGKYVELERKAYQQVVDGKEVDLFTLKNEQGMQVKITNYAGKIVQILVPDAKGQLGDVVQGFDSLEQTKNGAPYYGVTVGRYANRINKGQFRLEGQDYQLTINDGVNHLHGGTHGSAFVVFDAEQLDARTLKLNYVFKDGEEGYPGNCTLTVVYSLTDDNALQIKYEAVTDKPTVVNFTNHAFFNLSGEGHGTVLDNELMINADRFTVVDKTFIPTGELRDVKGTPMDFSTPMTIGSRIDADYDQLKLAPGYDHNYVLNKAANELSLAARIYDPASGRQMEVYTTEPGLQFYSGNFLTGKGKHVGKGGKPYGPHAAFCMETQHFPDSPNHPEFPSTQLNPDQMFTSTTIYKFSVR